MQMVQLQGIPITQKGLVRVPTEAMADPVRSSASPSAAGGKRRFDASMERNGLGAAPQGTARVRTKWLCSLLGQGHGVVTCAPVSRPPASPLVSRLAE